MSSGEESTVTTRFRPFPAARIAKLGSGAFSSSSEEVELERGARAGVKRGGGIARAELLRSRGPADFGSTGELKRLVESRVSSAVPS